jgi:hypothetical protein
VICRSIRLAVAAIAVILTLPVAAGAQEPSTSAPATTAPSAQSTDPGGQSTDPSTVPGGQSTDPSTVPGGQSTDPSAQGTGPGAAPTTAPPAATTAPPAATAAPAPAARDTGPDAGDRAAVLLLLFFGALALLALVLWGLARWQAWDPAWLARWRHATGEAGWRAGNAWAEFTDWLRLGR